jgi:transposase
VTPEEEICDQVKALYDSGLMLREISARVGWNRNLVKDALALWHTRRGEPVPDFRTQVKRLRGQTKAATIADRVMPLLNAGMSIKNVAVQLGVSRNLVTRAIAFWHKSRGLPAPDGRNLRRLNNPRRRGKLA